jgi:hypothetical protein
MKTTIAAILAAICVFMATRLVTRPTGKPAASNAPAAVEPAQPVVAPDARELNRLTLAMQAAQRRTPSLASEGREEELLQLGSKLDIFATEQERVLEEFEQRIEELERQNSQLREDYEEIWARLKLIERDGRD